MKLYYFETPNAHKPCAVNKHVGSPAELVRINLRNDEHKTPEFMAINPNGKIPALKDGDTRLWESHAIMCHLAHKTGSDLWPADPDSQIDVIRWLNWDTAHFSRHAGRLFFQRFIKPVFGLGTADEAEIEEATGFFHRFAEVLNNHLRDRNHLVGDTLSVADFGVASFLPVADQAELPLEQYDEINRWHDAMMELPAWREPYSA